MNMRKKVNGRKKLEDRIYGKWSKNDKNRRLNHRE